MNESMCSVFPLLAVLGVTINNIKRKPKSLHSTANSKTKKCCFFYIPTEVLSEAIFHSVDPYMRPYMARYPVGVTMIGGQIAK